MNALGHLALVEIILIAIGKNGACSVVTGHYHPSWLLGVVKHIEWGCIASLAFGLHRSWPRGQPMFSRMKPRPSSPKNRPSFTFTWAFRIRSISSSWERFSARQSSHMR